MSDLVFRSDLDLPARVRADVSALARFAIEQPEIASLACGALDGKRMTPQAAAYSGRLLRTLLETGECPAIYDALLIVSGVAICRDEAWASDLWRLEMIPWIEGRAAARELVKTIHAFQVALREDLAAFDEACESLPQPQDFASLHPAERTDADSHAPAAA